MKLLFKFVAASLILWSLRAPAAAIEPGPQALVRQYCRLDALSGRASPRGRAPMAALTDWLLEPAWDQLVMIKGYTVGTATQVAPGQRIVPVTYDVVGRVTAAAIDATPARETIQFEVGSRPDGRWVLKGPLLPPHVFAQEVDPQRVQKMLRSASSAYVSNSVFLWSLFRGAGWDLGFQPIEELAGGIAFRSVTEPAPGDVVVYRRESTAYHAGVLDLHGDVISATLDRGIVRSTVDAFPGSTQYLRLVEPIASEP